MECNLELERWAALIRIHIILSSHPVIAVCDEQGSKPSTARLDSMSQNLQGHTQLDWSPHPKGDTYITASGG